MSRARDACRTQQGATWEPGGKCANEKKCNADRAENQPMAPRPSVRLRKQGAESTQVAMEDAIEAAKALLLDAFPEGNEHVTRFCVSRSVTG